MSELKKEIKGRTIELHSYNDHKRNMDTLELKLIKIYSRSHETIDGVRRKITKRRRLKLGYDAIDKHVKTLNIDKDSLNQVRIIEA